MLDLGEFVSFQVVDGIPHDVVDVDAAYLIHEEACPLAVDFQ